ncbi:hypothetical protein MM221_06230 [Salipaludibacillus sp. LMS25]|uniref:DUF6792 domain-containing protein n=1 Tax=Salipaludibacillus sp. LMS25 TaxID=2924031 RepID=UPI0020D073CE|nr:DUF6792 domain-containing protein [Salipaludibacillus sp. LMS25]UTR16154.1 hypothetical protein MM221_06230 [Salipaludibacillus sp. LMS25]
MKVRFIIKETGTEPPANITIYSSDDFSELREGGYYSGFDGSAIHFYDEEKGINQTNVLLLNNFPINDLKDKGFIVKEGRDRRYGERRMSLRLKFMLIHMMLLMGGCDVNVQDTRAFQDEFTSEFMQSTTETEEGYYTFESGTGGYTMLFPVEGQIDDATYYNQKAVNEVFTFGVRNEKDNVAYGFKLTYEDRGTTEKIDTYLKILSNRVNYDGEYNIFKQNNKTYYYAKRVIKASNAYFIFGYIKADNDNKGIEFISNISCLDNDKRCEIEIESEEEKIKKIMKSIEFK